MAEALTRVRARCSTKGCPWPREFPHIPWCREIPGHQCFGGPTHCHWPKLGMGGGRRKESRIVAILCAGLHDSVDNGTKYGNAVITDGEGREVYRLWAKDSPGKTLVERVIGPRQELSS